MGLNLPLSEIPHTPCYSAHEPPCRLLRLLRLLRVAQLMFRSPKTSVGIPSFVNRAWISLMQIGYAAGFLINLLGCLWCDSRPLCSKPYHAGHGLCFRSSDMSGLWVAQ